MEQAINGIEDAIAKELQRKYDDLEDKTDGIPNCKDFLEEYGEEALQEIAKGAYHGFKKWDDFVREAFKRKHHLDGETVKLSAHELDVLDSLYWVYSIEYPKLTSHLSNLTLEKSLPKLEKLGYLTIIHNEQKANKIIRITQKGLDLLSPWKPKDLRVYERNYNTNLTREELIIIYRREYQGVKKGLLSSLDPAFYGILRRSGNKDIVPLYQG